MTVRLIMYDVILVGNYMSLLTSSNASWAPENRTATALIDNISDELFLTVVGCNDADLFSGVSEQSHVLENSYHIFGLPEILVEVRGGAELSLSLELRYIDQLEGVDETRVTHFVSWIL